MLHVECSGSPYEIGFKHGTEAKFHISRTISFYAALFHKSAKIDWPRVREIAAEFEPVIRKKWPAYLEEMQGLAAGASVEPIDIIAINVRTEINFGLASDGCTALSWTSPTPSNSTTSSTPPFSFLAQNWDWQEAQKQNLISLTITQPAKPTIKMITEAGLIGKIGLNSAGVGVCLNAIRAQGMDPTRLPCHLGLRMVLESTSKVEAVARLQKYGIASACHILVADGTGGVGMEWSYVGGAKVGMNERGQVFHSNHYLLPHPGVKELNFLGDSGFRVGRIEELCKEIEVPEMESVRKLFEDEENYPAAICRKQEGECESASLFGIVMDLKAKRARVTLGRPVAPEEDIELVFEQ